MGHREGVKKRYGGGYVEKQGERGGVYNRGGGEGENGDFNWVREV